MADIKNNIFYHVLLYLMGHCFSHPESSDDQEGQNEQPMSTSSSLSKTVRSLDLHETEIKQKINVT